MDLLIRPIPLKDYLQLVYNRKRIVKDIWTGLKVKVVNIGSVIKGGVWDALGSPWMGWGRLGYRQGDCRGVASLWAGQEHQTRNPTKAG